MDARLALCFAVAWWCGACSLVGLSDDIRIEGCETDSDCASLSSDGGANSCGAFVCGDRGLCERARRAAGEDGSVDTECAPNPPIDGGVSGAR